MLIDAWKNVVANDKTDNSENLARIFMACRGDQKPKLWDMVNEVFGEIETKLGTVDKAPLKKACDAAEEHSVNAYHNEYHNREVTLVTSLLLLNHIREGNKSGFTSRDARNLVMAAAVHDLGHDGGSNTVAGVHKPLRLERNSLVKSKEIWAGLDVTTADMRFISACVIPTDISKPKEGLSPRDNLIAKFNNASARANVYDNKMWRDAAAMLSDADLAISGALSPDMFAVNSLTLEEETKGAVPANIGSAKYYLNNVMSSFPLSAEGRNVLQNGYNKVRTTVLGA